MEKSTSEKNSHSHDGESYADYRRRLVRESQRKRRARAKDEGLCIICVKNPAEEGYATCLDCYLRVIKWQKTHGRTNEK